MNTITPMKPKGPNVWVLSFRRIIRYFFPGEVAVASPKRFKKSKRKEINGWTEHNERKKERTRQWQAKQQKAHE